LTLPVAVVRAVDDHGPLPCSRADRSSLALDRRMATPTGRSRRARYLRPLRIRSERYALLGATRATRQPAQACDSISGAVVRAQRVFRRRRYRLAFARLTGFEPGAAGPGGTRGRGDVQVGEELKTFRARVIDTLHGPLREGTDPVRRLQAAKTALDALTEP